MKIELRDPLTLRPHKLHRHLPEPDQTTPEWFSFLDELHAAGAENMPEILITDTGFVIDGWRRTLAAKNWKWPQVRCVIRPDEDAALVIVGALFGQRDMSRGAKVYFAIPLLPDYAEAAEKRRLENLRKGVKSNEKPLIFPKSSDSTSGSSVEAICERFGIQRDTWFSAVQLRDILHNPQSPHLAELLGKGHKKSADVKALQAELRKEFEPQLASGEKGIWFVRSAIAGRLVKEGVDREDREPLQLDFWTTPIHQWRTGFRSWKKLDEATRERIAVEWSGMLADLPAELLEATQAALQEA